jgi:DNA polymerase-4
MQTPEAPRTIIHLDLDAFFCAVEELRDPTLKGKPFAVGGRPDQRGVVSSCSYAARQFGVRSAMPMTRALRECPRLQIVSPHFQEYRTASKEVMARIHALTPLVEQISIDEAFFDATNLPLDGETTARQLQRTIIDELHLPCSLGVASNKLVAKIATDYGKKQRRSAEPPCALTVVAPGEESRFLAPLAVDMLWGVGPKTAARLAELEVKTIGDLAAVPEPDLVRRFGKYGVDLARHARGMDDRPITTYYPPKSFSEEITFARDIAHEKELIDHILEMSGQVARRLQAHQVKAGTIRLKLRWPNFTTLTRQTTLDHPTDQADVISDHAQRLFRSVWQRGQLVRLLGVGASALTGAVSRAKPPGDSDQPGFWDENFNPLVENERDRRLDELVQELQRRFGDRMVKRGFN